jgi:hypothetical protein
MIEISIPRFGIGKPPSGKLLISRIVSDYTGTLSCGGKLTPGVAERLRKLKALVDIDVVSLDSFGTAHDELRVIPLKPHILRTNEHDEEKRLYLSAHKEKLVKLGIKTVGELRSLEPARLEQEFGRYGVRLYELARGIDENPVVPDRPTKSISVEDTFQEDVLLADTEPMIRRLAEKLWSASRKESRIPRTIVLKLKTREFKILTRSYTSENPPSSRDELTDIALRQRDRVDLSPQQRFRLVGVGLSNFQDA